MRILSVSLSRLGAGWLPILGSHDGAPESVAWLQPADARVQLPEGASEARLLRGNARAQEPAVQSPDEVSVLWVTHLPEGGDIAGAALERLLRVASARSSRALWVLLASPLSEAVCPGPWFRQVSLRSLTEV